MITKLIKLDLVSHRSHLQLCSVPKDQIDDAAWREIYRVSQVVASLMEWRNLTQEGLHGRSGVSLAQIGRVVQASSDVGLSTYVRIARGLKVPLFWLFTEDWPHYIDEHEGGSGSGARGGAQGG